MKKIMTTISALFLATTLNATNISQEFTFFNEKENPNESQQTLHYSIEHKDNLEKIVARLKTSTLEGSYIYEKNGNEILYSVTSNDTTHQYTLQQHEKPLVKVFEDLAKKLEKYGIKGMPQCVDYPQTLWSITGDSHNPKKKYENIKACKKGNYKIGDTNYMLLHITQKNNKKLPGVSVVKMVSVSMFVSEDAQIPWIHVELTTSVPLVNFWDYTCFNQKLESKGVYNNDFARICAQKTGASISAYTK